VGPVQVYYAAGNNWVYLGQCTPTESFGTPSAYARGIIRIAIDRRSARGTFRLKFVYNGDFRHYGAVGYGAFVVR
jgi:hypothetical protein